MEEPASKGKFKDAANIQVSIDIEENLCREACETGTASHESFHDLCGG